MSFYPLFFMCCIVPITLFSIFASSVALQKRSSTDIKPTTGKATEGLEKIILRNLEGDFTHLYS